jgi:hypothetical protein
MEPPTKAETAAIFKYQSRNFISHCKHNHNFEKEKEKKKSILKPRTGSAMLFWVIEIM